MIKKDTSRENHIIDSCYNEDFDSQDITELIDDRFREKLEKSLEKMDSIEALDFNLDINILDIITKAETIKHKKKLRFESIAFISLCLLIISFFIFLALNVNLKFILFFEVLVSILLPLALIPIAKSAKTRGNA